MHRFRRIVEEADGADIFVRRGGLQLVLERVAVEGEAEIVDGEAGCLGDCGLEVRQIEPPLDRDAIRLAFGLADVADGDIAAHDLHDQVGDLVGGRAGFRREKAGRKPRGFVQ